MTSGAFARTRAARLAGFVLAGLCLCAACGCEGAAKPTAIAASRPAGVTAASRPAEPAPLPAEALVSLDALQPPIPKPVNPPDSERLPPEAQRVVAEGEALLARRDYAAAADRLERAAGFDPENPRIR